MLRCSASPQPRHALKGRATCSRCGDGRYRITQHIKLPFRVIPVVEEQGQTKVLINLKVIANFSTKLFANKVNFTLPVPPNTARCNIKATAGKAVYEASKRAVVWRIRKFPGCMEYTLSAVVDRMQSTTKKAWVRPVGTRWMRHRKAVAGSVALAQPTRLFVGCAQCWM